MRVPGLKRVGRAGRLSLLAFLAVAGVAGAPRALLVGLSYQGSEISTLPGIELDLQIMEQVAHDFGIREIRKLWNEEATLQGIREALGELAEGVGSDDLVLVYFSGHGTRVADQGELDETDDNQDEVLVPFDAVPRNRTVQNVLVDEDFGQLLADIPSRNVLVVVDACNSGTATKSAALTLKPKVYTYPGYSPATQTRSRKGILQPVDARRGASNFIGIMAAQDDEFANATSKGSILTNAVHEAMHALKARKADSVTVEDLFGAVNEIVLREMAAIRGAASQHPNLYVPANSARLRQFRLPVAAAAGTDLRPPTDDPLINEWLDISRRAERPIEFKVNRLKFRPHPDPNNERTQCDRTRYAGSLLALEVVAPEDGYLNLVAVPQGKDAKIVLFPNAYKEDNSVRRGERVRIPVPGADYCHPTVLEPGDSHEWNLVVALFSESEKNLYRESGSRGTFKQTKLTPKPMLVGAGSDFEFQAAGSQMLLIQK